MCIYSKTQTLSIMDCLSQKANRVCIYYMYMYIEIQYKYSYCFQCSNKNEHSLIFKYKHFKNNLIKFEHLILTSELTQFSGGSV